MQQQQTAGKPGVVRQSAWTRFVKDHGSILMFLILFVLASVFVKNFFAVRNIFTVIKQAAVPLVACMGLMLILTTGGIDLSLGYTLGLCSVLLGMMTKRFGFPAWQAIPLTLLIGAAPVPPSPPEMRMPLAPALATPLAMVPTPPEETSLTVTRACSLAHCRS